MGKTKKPLTIATTDRTLHQSVEVVSELVEKGHTIVYVGEYDGAGTQLHEADVVIGPRCWRIDPALGKLDAQLKLMLAGVRAVKYPKGAM